jgi:hypothetical protein
MDDNMGSVETSGMVIGVQKNDSTILSLDVFTVDYGIMRWFGKIRPSCNIDHMFEDVVIGGRMRTETSGSMSTIEIMSQNTPAMKENGSYGNGKIFVETMRSIVFDGIPLDKLFVITKQAIKNFVLGFNCDVVLVKALYLLCREEGYAVDTIWLGSLEERDRDFAREIIASRYDFVPSPGACELAVSLRRWMLCL